MSRKTPEGRFKEYLAAELKRRFPGSVLLENDANAQQGIPDRLLLWEDRWAAFEAKADKNAKRQPNQPWWVEHLDQMSFAAFVYPENVEEVLDAVQYTFHSPRQARLPKR